MKKPKCPPGAAPRLLSASEARRTLVARLSPTVDRLRARFGALGLRPYQVFLVWTRWSGPERGEGNERVIKRTPILPLPLVEDLSGVSLSLVSGGVLPVGSVRVSQISALYSSDVLTGLTVPPDPEADRAKRVAGKGPFDPGAASLAREEVVDPYEFFWEIVEDGRSNDGRPPRRSRFRVLSAPFRRADKMDWAVILERVSEDADRDGKMRTETRVKNSCEDD